MEYYIFIQDNKINGAGQCPQLTEGVINFEVTEEVYRAFNEAPEKYLWNGEDVVENPEYEIQQLNKIKTLKYKEADKKATEYIESGNALYEIRPGLHIEATGDNIGKFTAFGFAYLIGKLAEDDLIEWTTKEDIKVNLTKQDVIDTLEGFKEVQAQIWNVQYHEYLKEITNALTIEEVEAIVFNYK